MWFSATRQELLAERIHYEIFANLVPNNRFNAIKYLYDRLNIIDAKAQGLLTRNGLLLTTVSIVASTQIGKSRVFLYDPLWQGVFAIAYVLLVVSTLATVGIMRLRFDSVTVIPQAAEAQLQLGCTCPAPRPGACAQRPICAYRRLHQSIIELAERDRHVRLSSARSLHTSTAYEDLFFEITVIRQKSLRFAQRCTIGAMVLFFLVIGTIFTQEAVRSYPSMAAAVP